MGKNSGACEPGQDSYVGSLIDKLDDINETPLNSMARDDSEKTKTV
jgi:hypothetical protein